MKYDPQRGDFYNAYQAYTTGYRSTHEAWRRLGRTGHGAKSLFALLLLPGDLIAVVTRFGIGERAFRVQAVLVMIMLALMVIVTIYGPSAGPDGGGPQLRPLMVFSGGLLACFVLQVLLIATRAHRGVEVDSESAGHPWPVFYLLTLNETVVRILIEPAVLTLLAVIAWKIWGVWLGGFLVWAIVAQLFLSASLLDAERNARRELRDAAIRAGERDEIPDYQKQRAYEARRATLITAGWCVSAVIWAWKRLRRRFR